MRRSVEKGQGGEMDFSRCAISQALMKQSVAKLLSPLFNNGLWLSPDGKNASSHQTDLLLLVASRLRGEPLYSSARVYILSGLI